MIFYFPKGNCHDIVPTKTLMQIVLVQELKDKIIHIKLHRVLTWFDQLCLHP